MFPPWSLSSHNLLYYLGVAACHPVARCLAHGGIIGINGLPVVAIVEVTIGQPHQQMRSILHANNRLLMISDAVDSWDIRVDIVDCCKKRMSLRKIAVEPIQL